MKDHADHADHARRTCNAKVQESSRYDYVDPTWTGAEIFVFVPRPRLPLIALTKRQESAQLSIIKLEPQPALNSGMTVVGIS